jgi:hypothetical protein
MKKDTERTPNISEDTHNRPSRRNEKGGEGFTFIQKDNNKREDKDCLETVK